MRHPQALQIEDQHGAPLSERGRSASCRGSAIGVGVELHADALVDEDVRSYHLLRPLVDQPREPGEVPSADALDQQRPAGRVVPHVIEHCFAERALEAYQRPVL